MTARTQMWPPIANYPELRFDSAYPWSMADRQRAAADYAIDQAIASDPVLADQFARALVAMLSMMSITARSYPMTQVQGVINAESRVEAAAISDLGDRIHAFGTRLMIFLSTHGFPNTAPEYQLLHRFFLSDWAPFYQAWRAWQDAHPHWGKAEAEHWAAELDRLRESATSMTDGMPDTFVGAVPDLTALKAFARKELDQHRLDHHKAALDWDQPMSIEAGWDGSLTPNTFVFGAMANEYKRIDANIDRGRTAYALITTPTGDVIYEREGTPPTVADTAVGYTGRLGNHSAAGRSFYAGRFGGELGPGPVYVGHGHGGGGHGHGGRGRGRRGFYGGWGGGWYGDYWGPYGYGWPVVLVDDDEAEVTVGRDVGQRRQSGRGRYR